MADEERLVDLLLTWEDRFEQGEDVSAEELCRDCPELAPALAARIQALKKVAWLNNTGGEGDRFPLPPPAGVAQPPTPLDAMPRANSERKKPMTVRIGVVCPFDNEGENDGDAETDRLLSLHRAGDAQARSLLIEYAWDRLHRLANRMLRGFPGVGRFEETGDVLHNALIRLYQALATVRPESPLHFWRLAAQQIRLELLDLARRWRLAGATEGQGPTPDDVPDSSGEPAPLEQWTLFHEVIENLPEEE